jgi:hypothetical protein
MRKEYERRAELAVNIFFFFFFINLYFFKANE